MSNAADSDANIGVSASLGHAGRHRQNRLLAIERLHLGTSHRHTAQPLGWAALYRNGDILHHVDKQRADGQLECLESVRTQAEGDLYSADSDVRKPGLGNHGSDRPLNCILRRGVQRAFDLLGHLLIGSGVRATRPVLEAETLDAVFHEPAAPLADRVLVHPEALGDFVALPAICAKQDHPSSIRYRPKGFVPTNLCSRKSCSLERDTAS